MYNAVEHNPFAPHRKIALVTVRKEQKMPGPFPGMDPYLESAERWPSIHSAMSTYLFDALDDVLPQGYAASLEERCRIVQTQRNIRPDVFAVRPTREVTPLAPESGRGAALMARPSAASEWDAADAPRIVQSMPFDPPEIYLDIVTVGSNSRVVTTIELLSPVNKQSGEGREQYLAKQRQTLASHTHLIEIDLLRAGPPTVACGRPVYADVPRYDYLMCLHRSGQEGLFETWPRTVRERLPRLRVPLLDGDADVPLDLQAALDRCYERGRLAQRIDYAQEPVPPLSPEDAAWADERLRASGLRPE